jgi:hypothetical protein
MEVTRRYALLILLDFCACIAGSFASIIIVHLLSSCYGLIAFSYILTGCYIISLNSQLHTLSNGLYSINV